MKLKYLKPIIEVKTSSLTDIARRKVRHKTDDEKKRYEKRQEKALKYLGELTVALKLLEERCFMGYVVDEKIYAYMEEQHQAETIYSGEFVKVYRHMKEGHFMIELSSVSDLANFRFKE